MTINSLPPSRVHPLTGGPVVKWGVLAQASAAAHYVSEGLMQSPLHSLDDSIAVLSVLETARAQLGAQ